MTITSVALVQVACVLVAVLGLVTLMLAMVRFEQRRPGRIPVVLLGAVLLLAPTGIVLWQSWTV